MTNVMYSVINLDSLRTETWFDLQNSALLISSNMLISVHMELQGIDATQQQVQ